jgi:hypothetical protein
MKKNIVIAAIVTFGLIGSALAQPSTNDPSGTGSEGTSKATVSGSGMNPSGTKMGSPAAGKSMKHSKKKSHKSSS